MPVDLAEWQTLYQAAATVDEVRALFTSDCGCVDDRHYEPCESCGTFVAPHGDSGVWNERDSLVRGCPTHGRNHCLTWDPHTPERCRDARARLLPTLNGDPR